MNSHPWPSCSKKSNGDSARHNILMIVTLLTVRLWV